MFRQALQSIWLAPDPAADRALTSGTLDEYDDGSDDRVALFCDGKRVTEFTVSKGRGAEFLRDCGLVRQ